MATLSGVFYKRVMADKIPTTPVNGAHIKALRKALGLTQVQVGEVVGVTGPAVAQWEKGEGIALENLSRLAKALRTTTDEIISRGIPVASGIHNSVTRIDINAGKAVPLVSLRGLTVQNMGSRKKEADSTGSRVISSIATSEDAIAFLIIDRSMEPEYRIGESVIVEPFTFEPGDHVVAHVKSQKITVFRQFEFDGADHCRLIPLNPQHQVLRFASDEWEREVEVLGVMVSHIRTRRSGHAS